MPGYIYESAPELLLTKIAELKGIIVKHKAKNVNGDFSFYENVIKVMQFSYRYMRELSFLAERNNHLEWENKMLRKFNEELQGRVFEIDLISKLDAENRLEDLLEESRKYTDHVLSLRELMKNNNTENDTLPA